MNSPPPIEVRGLRKIFRQTTTGQSVVAIDRLDLDISPREVVAIVGQTGCGKSTFFDLMIGLAAPTEGSIHIGDKSPHSDFDYFRGKIATVFQQDRLLPWRSALDNARLPLELIGLPEPEQRERALTWLQRLGLGDFTDAYPHEVSGGMRQRVAIARAFAVEPDILLGRKSLFGGLAASGWHVGSVCMKLMVADGQRMIREAVARGEKIAVWGPSPGFRELRWIKPVLAGDTISFSTVTESKRTSEKRPEWGILQSRASGINQRGEQVYSLLATAFVPRRNAGS